MDARIENLSAYIICKNEAEWIAPCIRSLAACAEIVVVDSGSTDATLDVVRSLAREGFPIRLFERDWPGYSAQQQFALEQCTKEWCLCIDADERLSDDLVAALPAHLARTDINGWELRLRSYIHDYGYRPEAARETTLLRLTRNGKARYRLDRLVHEGMNVDGRIGSIAKGNILHRRAPALREQLEKAIHYADLKAEQLFRAGRKPRYARMLFNPSVYFLRFFFLNRLFLMGWAGFVHCGMLAVYSFTTEALLFQKNMAARRDAKPDPDEEFRDRAPLPPAT
jgi:glycosyltransferase involved in cell wall biosynthesis